MPNAASQSGEGSENRPRAASSLGGRPASHGLFFLSAARILTVICGYALHVVAARWLVTAAYGNLVLVLSIMLWAKNLQSSFLLPGFAKVVSEDPRRMSAALAVGRKWYSLVAAGFLLALLGLSAVFVLSFENSALALLLVLGAWEIPFAAAHSLSSRLLISIRRYGAGSAVLSVYASMRAAIGCLLIFLGFGVFGGVAGQVLGSLMAAALGAYLLRKAACRLPSEEYPAMLSRSLSWTAYALPVTLSMSTLTALDLWMVKALLEDQTAVGVYGAAYSLARTPWLLALGLAGAVFPRVSGALAENNSELARSVATDAIRVVVIVFLPMCVLIGEAAPKLTILLFSHRYSAASIPLTLLLTASAFGGLVVASLSLLAASDRPGLRLATVLGLVPLSFGLNLLLIPEYGSIGAAAGTLIVMATGALVALALVRRLFELRLPALTFLRCGAAGLAVGVAAHFWPADGWMLPVKLGSLGILYLCLLFAFGELARRELGMALGIFPAPIRRRFSMFWLQ